MILVLSETLVAVEPSAHRADGTGVTCSASLLDDRSLHSSMLHSQIFEAAVIATRGAALLMTPSSAPAFATAFGASVCFAIGALFLTQQFFRSHAAR
jgi:hypothetical protein